jgi:ribosomal-protein-alanine N-acetyltransferase
VEGAVSGALRVRELEQRDLDAVLALEEAARPWTSHWPVDAYLGASPSGARAWVAEREGALLGFILVRSTLAEIAAVPGPAAEVEILNLAVEPSGRRCGTGAALVLAAMAEAACQGATDAFLEVRESNVAARCLYERLGFRVAGRRRRYYRDPPEDALVLRAVLPLPSGRPAVGR